MTDTLSNLDENCQPIFRFSPRTLMELSSLKVALNIWMQKFKEFYPPENTSYIDINKLDFNSEKLPNIPQKIRNEIDAWFFPITQQLNRWISYSKNVSGNFSYHRFNTRFNLVVFGGDGKVHFKNTAINFLEDNSLDNITKFEMACVYCVEEKIDLLWPLVSYTLNIDYLPFRNNFMLYYWKRRKQDELNRIPLQGFGRIEHLMIDMCRNMGNWSAVLYFLSLLHPIDRLQQINRFSTSGYFETIAYLLPFLEAPIQVQVVNTYSTRTLATFVERSDSYDHTIQVWLQMKDHLTGEQFYREVILRIIYLFDNSVCYPGTEHRIKTTFLDSILIEIWYSSPEHLKQFVLNVHFENFLYRLASCKRGFLKNFGRDISFLLAILSDVDIDSRKKFWDKNWSRLIAGVPPAQLDRLMALCLAENEIIDGFKRQLKDTDAFTEYCDELIHQKYSSELNEFLCYLYPDQEVRNTKVKLLHNNDHWKRIVFDLALVEEIQKYGEFVDNLFSDHILAQNFKNQFIFAEENVQHLCDVLAGRRFLEVKCIVETFASSEKRVELKETLLSMFRDMSMNGALYNFNEIDCQTFLTWCVDDKDQRIKCFKKSLPIDEIFQTAFLNCLKFNSNIIYGYDQYKTSCRFQDLNKFLGWYFESSDSCENFVREKIEYYGGMFEGDVERIFSMDEEHVVQTMKNELLPYQPGDICL